MTPNSEVGPSVGVIGCKSTNYTERPPRYGTSVQVVAYDSTPRKVNPDFQVFAREADVPQPFKIIAMVCRNAKPQDQGLMMQAISWRAKQLGADAMIVLPPEATGYSWGMAGNFAGGGPNQPIYRAHAVVYTSTPKS